MTTKVVAVEERPVMVSGTPFLNKAARNLFAFLDIF
jgi:hypothetical protein